MSKGVLEFTGIKYDGRSQQERPHFRKKDGGEWSMDPGTVDFHQFGPGKLFVTWDNWIIQSATTEIPKGGGKSWGGKPNVYHPETFVSNVVGQAIQAGAIKSPSEIAEWAKAATQSILAVQAKLASQGAQEAQKPVPAPTPQPDMEDDIPFN
jgi:hypothetical protein